jgi:hypothetical protein
MRFARPDRLKEFLSDRRRNIEMLSRNTSGIEWGARRIRELPRAAGFRHSAKLTAVADGDCHLAATGSDIGRIMEVIAAFPVSYISRLWAPDVSVVDNPRCIRSRHFAVGPSVRGRVASADRPILTGRENSSAGSAVGTIVAESIVPLSTRSCSLAGRWMRSASCFFETKAAAF